VPARWRRPRQPTLRFCSPMRRAREHSAPGKATAQWRAASMLPDAPNAGARSHHQQSSPKTRPTKSPALERTEQHTHSVPWTRPELRVLGKAGASPIGATDPLVANLATTQAEPRSRVMSRPRSRLLWQSRRRHCARPPAWPPDDERDRPGTAVGRAGLAGECTRRDRCRQPARRCSLHAKAQASGALRSG
jgi:hypothetical protein